MINRKVLGNIGNGDEVKAPFRIVEYTIQECMDEPGDKSTHRTENRPDDNRGDPRRCTRGKSTVNASHLCNKPWKIPLARPAPHRDRFQQFYRGTGFILAYALRVSGIVQRRIHRPGSLAGGVPFHVAHR
jgi:hypothetical protein